MFWLGLFIGGIIGFFTAAILAANKISRMDDVYRGRRGEE